MQPSDLLVRAADLIRDTAAAATGGPWRHHDTWIDVGGYTATVLSGDGNATQLRAWLPSFNSDAADDTGQFAQAWADARWVALMSPAVAPMIEYWLRAVAEHCERPGGNHYPAGCPVCAPAVKLARAVLGEKEEQ